jgi:hypothetical protein
LWHALNRRKENEDATILRDRVLCSPLGGEVIIVKAREAWVPGAALGAQVTIQ